MRRMFWTAVGLGAGVTAAVLTSRWMRRQTERMAPANMGRQLGDTARDIGQLVRESLEEWRKGMAEREAEIRAQLDS
ncbi:MAG: hypothetical protein ABR600_10535 [Actinomycetota bacterium]